MCYQMGEYLPLNFDDSCRITNWSIHNSMSPFSFLTARIAAVLGIGLFFSSAIFPFSERFWSVLFRTILMKKILVRTILVRTIPVRTILVRKILVSPDAFSSNCAQNLCKNQCVQNLKKNHASVHSQNCTKWKILQINCAEINVCTL